jgi:hypothetical protein
MNYAAIFEGFASRGIPEDEIKPRENVFTFWAWKALGRQVKKGEHGVKATTFVAVGSKQDTQTGEKKDGYRMARTTTVFHISQTEPMDADSATVSTIPQIVPALILVPGNAQFDSKLIGKFRTWADGLESKIEHAGRPMTQNPTPKRNREYQSRMHDCRNMERLQKALRALADDHETDTVPGSLTALKTKDEIGGMVRKSIDGSKGGYYSCIECDDFADKSSAARILQGMIEGNSAQRAERDRVRKIAELEAEVKLTTIPGFFPTPAPVVSIMLRRARLEAGMLVLEPSAGNGNIADALRAEGVEVRCIEPAYRLREILTLKGYTLIGDDLMETAGADTFDRVLMNPPFEKQADIDHVRKAFSMLKAGGILVSIMAPGFEFRSDRKSADFRQWLEDVDATCEDLPDGSFKSSGTGVGTRLVVIEKAA